jgi:hypothetical protein
VVRNFVALLEWCSKSSIRRLRITLVSTSHIILSWTTEDRKRSIRCGHERHCNIWPGDRQAVLLVSPVGSDMTQQFQKKCRDRNYILWTVWRFNVILKYTRRVSAKLLIRLARWKFRVMKSAASSPDFSIYIGMTITQSFENEISSLKDILTASKIVRIVFTHSSVEVARF